MLCIALVIIIIIIVVSYCIKCNSAQYSHCDQTEAGLKYKAVVRINSTVVKMHAWGNCHGKFGPGKFDPGGPNSPR